jgi:dihydroflavonol-4-reductase
MGEVTIVTGGAGFIGSHLVGLLTASGKRVRVVERRGASVGHLAPEVEVVFADIRDRAAIGAAMRDADQVYHLAANPNLWARNRGEFEAVNHQGTVNVLDTALEARARRVLHTSTESILTKASAIGLIDENVEIALDDTVGPYCRSKWKAEQYAFALARQGRPVVVANPTMPVGPGDRGLSPPTSLIRDFCLGKLPALMDCTLNLIDVRDAAKGLELVMERGRPGRRYLLGAANLTLAGLAGILSELSGTKPPRWRVPYAVGLAVAVVSEFWADRVTGRPPKASVTGVRLARRIMHFDTARTLKEIGLEPRHIRSALQDAVSWLREVGELPPASPS